MSKQEITVPKGLSEVDTAIFLVRFADRATAMTRELLWKINEDELWKEKFSSFDEFVESPEGLDKSRGWASKNLAVYKFFVLEHGFTREQLEGIDNERLYLARALPGSPEKVLQQAIALSRGELKDEVRDSAYGVHDHSLGEERWGRCSKCGKFERI
jgi:hypothetical protein